ncbi:putative purine permease 5 [Citrus sinensis]|uniref:Purine permease 5 n=2 Tax=Citrus sinensis TaxID=2711 RepID=A0ACB8IJU0_CITSI|nr:putative purine permease 5 [Citrus sinensis]
MDLSCVRNAADNLMYAYANAYLPASTAALLASSSLVFSTLFGYFLVKNKLNAAMINVVVIKTAAMTVIALDLDSDRYGNITDRQYIMGFVWDILGSALYDLIFALFELVFVKLVGRRSLLPRWLGTCDGTVRDGGCHANGYRCGGCVMVAVKRRGRGTKK